MRLAMILHHAAWNQIETARRGFAEALDIYELFAARDPEQFQSDVARIGRRLQTLTK